MKVMKAYKLCRLGKDGKIYPLYVLANNPLPIGVWLEAEEGIMASDNKHVKSRLGNLSFRPGFHVLDWSAGCSALHIGKKLHKNDKMPSFRPKDQVWCEVEIKADIHYNDYKSMKTVPKGGYYKFKTNANANCDWLIAGNMKVNRILTDEEVCEINKRCGTFDLPREV